MIAMPDSTSPPVASKPIRRGVRLEAMSLTLFLRALFVSISACLLVVSIFMPYWSLNLRAPQYPKGLYIEVLVNKMQPTRNVFEVDGLNHYIGMIKLEDAASIERSISVYAIPIIALLALASLMFTGKTRLLLRLPVILYPAIFAADLFAWLYYAGHSLDPHAPMSSSIDEFTPRILGNGTIGQFRTEAHLETGFYLALAAAVILLAVTIGERWSRHEVA
jgi:copper chaperone NosL